MKLHPRFRPEACVSDDPDRSHLSEPYLDVASKTLSATNGHVLVRVPAEVDSNDRTSVALDVNYLNAIVRALGAGYRGRKKKTKRPIVVLTFRPPTLKQLALGVPPSNTVDTPITVRADRPDGGRGWDEESIGILMPVRS